MLVLSRRETDKVLFPTLGISIEVLRIRGNTARLGIDAPAEIPVLRHEIAHPKSLELTPDADRTRQQLRDMIHAVRRRLDSAATSLNGLHQELERDQNQAAQQIVSHLYRDLQALEHEANQAIDWTSTARPLKVLVVEDSAAERKLLAAVLEMSGLNVITAKDGEDALDFLSLHATPDVVLVDMLMPRCDGPSFVQQVRANTQLRQPKIFAVSSIQPASLGLVTGAGGIDGWFPKPVETAQLVSTLGRRLSESTAA
jgi:carbon storage regulator CsrA